MAFERLAVLEGELVKMKIGTLSIQKSANDRSKLSGTLCGLSSWPALGDRFGLVKDVSPGARTFNGSSSVLSRTFASGTVDNLTFGVWVSLASLTGGGRYPLYIGRYDAGTAANRNGYGLHVTADGTWQVICFRSDGATISAGGTAAQLGWHLLIGRRASGTWTFFVDGEASGSTSSTAPTAVNGHWGIGALPVTGGTFINYMSAHLAHAFLAHAALTDTQIRSLARGGPGGMGVALDTVVTGTYWYYPIRGLAAPETDSTGLPDLAVANAPATTDGPLVLSSDAIALFAGEIDQAPVSGLDDQPLDDAQVRIGASDHNGLIGRRLVSGARSSETLKARLTWLATYLAVYGVTLDASQDDGPTLVANTYDYTPMATVFSDLTAECAEQGSPRLPEIDEVLTLRMLAASGQSAPFDISEDDADSPLVGDLTVEPSRLGGYANKVVMRLGDAREVVKTESFTGTGSTATFALSYPFIRGRAVVYVNDGSNNNVEEMNAGATPRWTVANNLLTRNAGNLPSGHVVTITYDAQFPMVVTATDAEHATNPIEALVSREDLFDLVQGQAAADAELAARKSLGAQSTVRYSTHTDGLRIGQTQGIKYPTTRGVDDDFIIIEQRISDVADGASFKYDITAVNGVNFQTWRQKSRGGGSAGPSTPIVTGTVLMLASDPVTPAVGAVSPQTLRYSVRRHTYSLGEATDRHLAGIAYPSTGPPMDAPGAVYVIYDPNGANRTIDHIYSEGVFDGPQGQLLIIENWSDTYTLTVQPRNGFSSNPHRNILTPGMAPVAIGPGRNATFVYRSLGAGTIGSFTNDPTFSGWKLISYT